MNCQEVLVGNGLSARQVLYGLREMPCEDFMFDLLDDSNILLLVLVTQIAAVEKSLNGSNI